MIGLGSGVIYKENENEKPCFLAWSVKPLEIQEGLVCVNSVVQSGMKKAQL